MSKSFFALAFALSLIPAGALAQDTSAPPASSDAQRQQMRQTMQSFIQQEEQLHEQMRGQILSSLTPVHRRAIAAEIGELVISANPDSEATAKRIDSILSPGERSRIVAAHQAFATQSRALHDQMKAQLQQMMPAGHLGMGDHPMMGEAMQREMNDAGWIVLHALPPHAPGMMGHMM
ncbi:MAG: hypothetical protein WAK16_06930 [Candidatus Cybelea sp.]